MIDTCSVVGARRGFVEMAPVILQTRKRGISQVIVHTGQHYAPEMSAAFIDDLGLPKPDVHLCRVLRIPHRVDSQDHDSL